MDLMLIPIVAIIAGTLSGVGIIAVVLDYKKKEKELAHKEKVLHLEIEKLKLEKEVHEKNS